MWPKETLLRGSRKLQTKGHSSAAPNGDPGNNLPNPGEKKVYKRRHIRAMKQYTEINKWATATYNNAEES